MNMTKYSSLLLVVLLLFLSIPVDVRGADEKPEQTRRLARLYSELQTLFRHYYPEVTSNLQNGEIHFEHDTRLFSIPSASKDGKRRYASQERGPNRGGILCDICLREGKWGGQALVPQTFNKHYFKVLLMAPYSPTHDAHLCVHLYYPEDVNQDFLNEFTRLIDDFPKYIN